MLPIETAKRFLLNGIAVVPIVYKSKQPGVKWKDYQTIPPTLTELDTWFGGGVLHNIGVICGWRGLTVLDFDTVQEYARWTTWARKRGGRARIVVDQAYRVRSSRGVHVYIRLPYQEKGITVGKVQVLGKMDIKGHGGYVLGPGSVHPSGAIYTPMPGHETWIFPIVEALSDVLPATMLIQHTDQPVTVKPLAPLATPTTDDPWEAAAKVANSQSLIAEIRQRFRVEQFFIGPEKTSSDGRWLRAVCPFHDDNSPSFWLDTSKQICGCYSPQCRAHDRPLDVINLFAWLHRLSNEDAIAELRKRL